MENNARLQIHAELDCHHENSGFTDLSRPPQSQPELRPQTYGVEGVDIGDVNPVKIVGPDGLDVVSEKGAGFRQIVKPRDVEADSRMSQNVVWPSG